MSAITSSELPLPDSINYPHYLRTANLWQAGHHTKPATGSGIISAAAADLRGFMASSNTRNEGKNILSSYWVQVGRAQRGWASLMGCLLNIERFGGNYSLLHTSNRARRYKDGKITFRWHTSSICSPVWSPYQSSNPATAWRCSTACLDVSSHILSYFLSIYPILSSTRSSYSRRYTCFTPTLFWTVLGETKQTQTRNPNIESRSPVYQNEGRAIR